jgi:L-2,4-diaminobutyric acid acetyltransferase
MLISSRILIRTLNINGTPMTSTIQNAQRSPVQITQQRWDFRTPTRLDGKAIHELIAQCPPLDENSAYCNFLQSSHFQNTCVLAEQDEQVVGFVSAYCKPDKLNEIFVWQVAVHPNARGIGLASEMLDELLAKDELQQVEYLETTITEDNQGSWSLFKKLDRAQGGKGTISIFLDEKRHFEGEHDTEYLYRIPLNKNVNQ